MSFKEGVGDRIKDKRVFTDFTDTTLTALVESIDLLDIQNVWVTEDALSSERPRWVNCIALRRADA